MDRREFSALVDESSVIFFYLEVDESSVVDESSDLW